MEGGNLYLNSYISVVKLPFDPFLQARPLVLKKYLGVQFAGKEEWVGKTFYQKNVFYLKLSLGGYEWIEHNEISLNFYDNQINFIVYPYGRISKDFFSEKFQFIIH